MPATPTRLSSTTATADTGQALLSVEDAAARLGTPVRFIRRLIAERRIPFHKIGRYVRITEADLAAFVANGRIEDREHTTMPPWTPRPRRTRH